MDGGIWTFLGVLTYRMIAYLVEERDSIPCNVLRRYV